MEKYLLIAVGGSLGSIARYWVGSTISGRLGTKFPYGTLVINITACVIIGFALTYLGRRAELNPAWRFLIPVGFVGAYSTFSTYEWETFFNSSLRRLPSRRAIRCQQPPSWTHGCVGRLSAHGGIGVRTHRQLVTYQSILQVLHESGCPVCRFLKEFQTSRLQNRSEAETHRLCNFHAWGLAAVQDAPIAAQAFIGILNEPDVNANGAQACNVCDEVRAEEDLRIRELATCLHRPDVADWLRTKAFLCIPHATKLRREVPPVLASRIDAIVQNCRQQLKLELDQLRDEPSSDRSGWGSLGRAAEFLVSQRGLRV